MNVLPLAGPQEALDPFLRGPPFGVGEFTTRRATPHRASASPPLGVERLERLKAEKAGVAERPDHPSLVGSAEWRAQSSITSVARAIARIGSMSHDRPHRCVGSTALVRGVMRAGCPAERERGRIDVREHRRQAGYRTISGTTQKVKAGTTTSLPAEAPGLEDEKSAILLTCGAGADVSGPEHSDEFMLERFDVGTLQELSARAAILDDF
jgi:hypothetical protein